MRLAALFTCVTVCTAAAIFYGVLAMRPPHPQALPVLLAAQHTVTPTAVEFGRALMGTANQLNVDAGVADPHCVRAAPGRYMCAFAMVRGAARECHLMQGRSTPQAESASTITVT